MPLYNVCGMKGCLTWNGEGRQEGRENLVYIWLHVFERVDGEERVDLK